MQDLSQQPFDVIQEMNDPNDALDMWYHLLINILNKHAPLVTKRVKNKYQTEWYNDEIRESGFQRDHFHKIKDMENFRKYRNKTNKLIRSSKSKFFIDAINEDKSCKILWRHFKNLSSTTRDDIDMIMYEGNTLTL